jgi:dethiobiotin synthetase
VTAFFVTSSGTGVGKTLVTAALTFQLRNAGRGVRALKPILSGYDETDAKTSDSGVLLSALGKDPTPEAVALITPWRFATPLSPDMAASRENRDIDFTALCDFCRSQIDAAGAENQITLIEGVGGVLVPLTGRETVADWIAALDMKPVLVVGSYLGALSHGLTAWEVMKARGISPVSVIIVQSRDAPVSLDETHTTLARFLPPLPIVALPRLAPADRIWETAPDLLPALAMV